MKVSNDDHVTVKLHFVTLALVALGPLLPVKDFLPENGNFSEIFKVLFLRQKLIPKTC